MKHVVTAASIRHIVLLTGFDAFPGAPRNPTAAIVAAMEGRTARLSRLGIDLRRQIIPVVFDSLDGILQEAVERHRPDTILHLGLASRRSGISVETRAVNRAGPLHPDASGRVAPQCLAAGGPSALKATYPSVRIAAALRSSGFRAALSRDAGDYVCNAALYTSLRAAAAPQIGFLHVPRPQRLMQPRARTRRRKPTLEELTQATVIAILATAKGWMAHRLARLHDDTES